MSTREANAITAKQKAPVPDLGRSPIWVVDFYRSALGKKYVMALTGIVGLGFIVVHALGNLHMFEGAIAYSAYGFGLRNLGAPLIPHGMLLNVARGVLLLAVLLHVHAAVSLTAMNRKKRPVQYQGPRHYIAADYASRTMPYTGVIVLLFIIFHIADLTLGMTSSEFVHGAVTNNLVSSLSRIPVGLFYMFAMLALGLHIYHGTWSLFQTLGWNNTRFNVSRRYLAVMVTVFVVGINMMIPLLAMTGGVSCDEECQAVTEEAEAGTFDAEMLEAEFHGEHE